MTRAKRFSGMWSRRRELSKRASLCVRFVEDVRRLGDSKLTLQIHNETAIVKRLSEALRELRIEGAASAPVLLEEHSPEYDPQANGSAE